MTRYMRWLAAERGLDFDDYARAVAAGRSTELEEFWASIWEFFGVARRRRPTSACSPSARCPGARWFEGAELNYAEHVFRGKADRPRWRSCTPPSCASSASSAGASCATRSRRSRPGCARSASSPAIASSPTCRTSPRR